MKSGFLFSCRFSAALLTLIPALTTRSAASAAPADFDLQGFVDKQLADGVKKIVIPAGTSHALPPRATSILSSKISRGLRS